MKKHNSKIPKFKSVDDEFEFWSTHDSMDYFGEFETVKETFEFKDIKRPKERITMLLDPRLKKYLQKIAAEKGLPYQTLIQMWLKERAHLEIKKRIVS